VVAGAGRYGRDLGKPDLLAGALLNAGLAAWPADHATGFARYDEALSVIRGLIAEPGGLATYGPTFINWVNWPVKDHLLQDETYRQQLEGFQAEATAIANRLSND
jgi:hypothetical protein